MHAIPFEWGQDFTPSYKKESGVLSDDDPGLYRTVMRDDLSVVRSDYDTSLYGYLISDNDWSLVAGFHIEQSDTDFYCATVSNVGSYPDIDLGLDGDAISDVDSGLDDDTVTDGDVGSDRGRWMHVGSKSNLETLCGEMPCPPATEL